MSIPPFSERHSGLPTILGRRRELLLGYSNHLRASGLTVGRYAPDVLLPVTLDERAMMQRWKQYVQGKTSAYLITDSFRKLRHSRVARVVFDGWRTGIGPKQRNRARAKAAARAEVAKEVLLAEELTKVSETPGETQTCEAEVTEKYVKVSGQVGFSDINSASFFFATSSQLAEGGQEPMRSGVVSLTRNAPGVSPAESIPAATAIVMPADEWSEAHGNAVWRPRKAFAERRAEADLKVARRTVVAAWRGSLAREIGLRQARQQRKVKQLARREPT